MTVRTFAMFVALAACQSSPPAPPAAVAATESPAARGLIEASEPPARAILWQRPEWRVGDRFVLARGERMRFPLRVEAVHDTHYELAAGGAVLRRDRDLGNLGEWSPAGEPLHVLAPVDVRFHWPLWLGKRWACEFVDRAGGSGVAVRADYVVEELDQVTVPAGTFAALRIVRTVRRLDDGEDWLPRTQISWYAPDVGHEVRQLVGDAMVELVEYGPAR